jgi:hypothetical protein
MEMRTRTPAANTASPKQVIDQVTATRIVQETTNAIMPETATSFGSTYEFYQTFQTKYAEALKPNNLIGLTPDQAYGVIENALNNASDAVKNYYSSPGKSVLTQQQVESLAANLLQDLKTTLKTTASTVVANVQPKPFEAPTDVSCSMSILAWKETSDIFGRRVANTYVAIQVTIRNLNSTNEFLIHDIQVAIDTGMDTDDLGRFQAGRDKLLVRAVAQRGQTEDRRNLVVNSLVAAGSIAAASSITAGTIEFKDAVAVFQGAFIPGFDTLFPDHTVEQLNHINDLVFSSSSTSKVLVPVQGSVPLVTFISQKPIGQLPFAWCGYRQKDGARRHCGFNEPAYPYAA